MGKAPFFIEVKEKTTPYKFTNPIKTIFTFSVSHKDKCAKLLYNTVFY